MTIRLETSKKRGIENFQDSELTALDLKLARDLERRHLSAKTRLPSSAAFSGTDP
jgi:hypothetical protein